MNKFQQKYIKTWAGIVNTHSSILLKSRRASEILSYLGIEKGRERRRNYIVTLARELLP